MCYTIYFEKSVTFSHSSPNVSERDFTVVLKNSCFYGRIRLTDCHTERGWAFAGFRNYKKSIGISAEGTNDTAAVCKNQYR